MNKELTEALKALQEAVNKKLGGDWTIVHFNDGSHTIFDEMEEKEKNMQHGLTVAYMCGYYDCKKGITKTYNQIEKEIGEKAVSEFQTSLIEKMEEEVKNNLVIIRPAGMTRSYIAGLQKAIELIKNHK